MDVPLVNEKTDSSLRLCYAFCYRNDENGKCHIKKEFVYTGFSCDVVQGHWVKSVWGNEGG